jgi:hypothetical protein
MRVEGHAPDYGGTMDKKAGSHRAKHAKRGANRAASGRHVEADGMNHEQPMVTPEPLQAVKEETSAGRAKANGLKNEQPVAILDPLQTVNRRKVLGLAAAGVAGGYALSEVAFPSVASAATTTEPGALAPAVVNLTDAPTIALDASSGNDFRVTIAASRTMGNPANPSDGQKIVLQITQGAPGSNTITWGNTFDFSSGLPQPTLSTTAGQTDLLAFIYNAAMGKWLLAAFVNGFNPTTTTTAPPPGTFRLFPSTSGPSSAVAYGGSFLAGVVFQVTTGGTWLDGFWWWVCASGQPTSSQKFALWALYNSGIGALVPAATVTSGPLTAGQWNFVPLAAPVPLAAGACYNVCTGFTGGFPDTNGQFGAGDAYSAGIVSGPLSAFSDQSGTLPAPFSMPQGLFGVAGTDPTVYMPSDGFESANFWMDLQVGTAPPAGTSYRLWPSYPMLPGVASISTVGYTVANEFRLSQSCTLDNIWFYSGPGAMALPTRCAIWNVGTQAEVAGTDNSSPPWSGSAGSGWVACAYSGVTLSPGDYKVAAFSPGGSPWFQLTPDYWANGGAGTNGITTGPLTAPGSSTATSPGQGTYNAGSWAYPLTGGTGENFWVDAEVTPS